MLSTNLPFILQKELVDLNPTPLGLDHTVEIKGLQLNTHTKLTRYGRFFLFVLFVVCVCVCVCVLLLLVVVVVVVFGGRFHCMSHTFQQKKFHSIV